MGKMLQAYCWASGLIEFGPRTPDGALPIAKGPSTALRDVIDANARHFYDGASLVIPGVPEAKTPNAAVDALLAWNSRVARALTQRLAEENARRGGAVMDASTISTIAKAEGRS